MIDLRSITILCSIALSMLVVLSIMGIANLNINSNLTNDQNNVREALADKNSQQESLIILKHQLSKTFMGNWVVKGQVINSGTNKINYAIINVNFFDKNGNLLYSGPVNINDIKPGEKKDFEVDYYGSNDKLDSYKITSNIMA